MNKLLYILLFQLILPAVVAQSKAADDLVRTLTVRVKENWQVPPVIELNGDQSIEIKFDYLDLNVHYFYYKITHCDASWKPTDISESEFLNGFNNQPIEIHKTSFNTYENYTNYQFTIPNDNLKVRLSGNYQVTIYDNDNPETVIATARFSVYERLVNVGATINTITDIDYNRGHQQLDLQIDTRNYTIRTPQMEMKVVVNQNSRTDNQALLTIPTITQGSNLLFTHVRDLIFEAGNEFRRFEMVSYRYNGLNVEQIKHINPYFHAFLYRDKIKTFSTYVYDQDQDGRCFIRNSEAQDFDNESDYFVTHFSLASDAPIGNGKLYILGEFNGFKIDPAWEMEYDIDQRAYTKKISLKQGAYNYQYIFVPDGQQKGTTALTDGNFYETENEYTVRVFHRPIGGRYDRLVGYGLFKSTK
ncbi:MAG: DUF5103 domain-containing protein [Bacteroidales bacterium]|nr:DUF5103 domain-containing protein [Bacteroidales bacterium]